MLLKLKSHETMAILNLSTRTSILYIIVGEIHEGLVCYSRTTRDETFTISLNTIHILGHE